MGIDILEPSYGVLYCDCCGKDVESGECVCPECPQCGAQGLLLCYNPDNEVGHGLFFTAEQLEGKRKYEAFLASRELFFSEPEPLGDNWDRP